MDLWLRAFVALPENHADDSYHLPVTSVPEKLMLSPGLHRYPHMLKTHMHRHAYKLKK